MKYLPLFDLRMRHAYYNNGRSPDFLIEPTHETARLLNNFRSMTKILPDGLRVVTAVKDSAEAFIKIPPGTVMSFELRLQNPEFALISDPRDIATSVSPLYSNANLSREEETEIELSSKEAWTQETLDVAEPSPAESFVLSGKPIKGVTVENFKLESAGPVAAVVAYDAQDNLISVDSRSASQGQKFTLKYPVTAPIPHGVYALIEIHVNDSLPNIAKPSKQSRQFHISFRAKQATWAYYCVTDLDNADTAYHIVDTPPAEEGAPLIFSDVNRRNLSADPDPLDDLAIELAERYPSLKRYRFLSDAPVACRQKAHKHLALQVNGNKLSGALPNPSFRNFSTGTVKVGDTLQQQDRLFEIFKVLTQNGA